VRIVGVEKNSEFEKMCKEKGFRGFGGTWWKECSSPAELDEARGDFKKHALGKPDKQGYVEIKI